MGIKGMNKKILYSIIGLVLVGGLFSAVYAGPIINTITFAGLTIYKEMPYTPKHCPN